MNRYNMRMGNPDDDGDPSDDGGGDAPWRHRAQPTGKAPRIKEAGPIKAAVCPKPLAFRSWTAALRQEASAASGRPDLSVSRLQAIG